MVERKEEEDKQIDGCLGCPRLVVTCGSVSSEPLKAIGPCMLTPCVSRLAVGLGQSSAASQVLGLYVGFFAHFFPFELKVECKASHVRQKALYYYP